MKNSIPLIIFLMLVVLFAAGLKLDPRKVPSPLINKPAPVLDLPRLYSKETRVTTHKMEGRVWLLNVWASWCGACRAEHSVINRLVKEHGLEVVGLNYKDDDISAKRWLRDHGNPYAMVGLDNNGNAGINWGVYGVPETFIIDGKGVIRYKSIGPVTQQEIDQKILPLISKLEHKS